MKSKAERLVIAERVAPALRRTDESTPESMRVEPRKIALVGKDGKVTGYTTHVVVAKKLLEAEKIAIEVLPGVRPKEIICVFCGVFVKVKRKGTIPSACKKCEKYAHCDTCGGSKSLRSVRQCGTCAGNAKKARLSCACGKVLGVAAGTPYNIARREGAPARCLTCYYEALKTPPKDRKTRAAKPRVQCDICHKVLGKSINSPSAVARRKGAPARCASCCLKKIAS